MLAISRETSTARNFLEGFYVVQEEVGELGKEERTETGAVAGPE